MILLVPGFGGGANQTLLTKITQALSPLPSRAVELAKRRPEASLAAEIEQLRELWLPHKGPIVGRSFGGRVAARLANVEPVPALVLLGFPIRPPGKPRPLDEKALQALKCPTLILQGENDELGAPDVLREVAGANTHITIEVIRGTKHSYGRKEKDVIARTVSFLSALR